MTISSIRGAIAFFAILAASAAQAQTPAETPAPGSLRPSAEPARLRPAPLRPSVGARAPNRQFRRGAARAAEVRGNTARPPTLLPGTFDLGNGLTFILNYTSQSAINPIGGIRQGSAYTGQILFGIDADLGRLAGIEGGSLHTLVTQRHGRSLSNDFIGNDTSVQEIYGGGQTARLTLLSYQQKLFDDRLDIEFGRLGANINFLSSPIYCNFQNNATCGSPVFAFKTTNFTFWPISTWGAHAKAWFTDRVFLHVGAYEVNPHTQRLIDNGIDWSTRGATGVVIPLELGYSTTLANDPLPRNYGLGAIVDRSDYADPVLNAAGRPLVFSGGDPLTRFGRSAIYARFDQMVWRPDPAAPQGLTLFGVAMKATEGRQTHDYYLEGGAILTGTFAGRPYDTAGFVISTQKFSSDGLANVRAARASLGLDPRDVATQQVMLELNYGIQITPAARLTPNLQYIINPDNTRFPFRTKNTPDAFVGGAKFSVDLFTLAGMAKGPGSL
ncbi:MAG: carbohydrate porin [Methylorubrum populi]